MADDTLGRLASGEVVVDRNNSHLHESVRPLLSYALSRISSCGRNFMEEVVDFFSEVGKTICVATNPSDKIVYAQRPNRAGLTRFVKNRETEPCSSVVVVLKRADNVSGTYVLVTAFIGGKPEVEPWDTRATAASRAFWESHALLWDPEQVIPGTETTECPW